MELNSNVFSQVLSPLAIYANEIDSEHARNGGSNERVSSPFRQPCPQGTTNGHAGRNLPKWRLDGVDLDGIRFFAVPTFAVNTPPMRVDVYLSPVEEHSECVRQALKPEEAMYTTNKKAALELPISQHLLEALDHWSSSVPDFETQYLSLPFGSQIVVPELTLDLFATASTIHLLPNYTVEQAMIPFATLSQLWPPSIVYPPTIDTTSLAFHSQLHEAITLVTIPSSPDPSRKYVFKSLLRDQKYLYNELKMLLTLPPHPNLVPRPLYIVTHKCRFGGKRGVAGFILEYYPLGSLASHLSSCSGNKTTLPDRFRWARQVTEALIHVNEAGGFYPDLKPDNVVLRQEEGGEVDAVLLDLEQRGGWFSWSPPEVGYVEYIEILASHAPDASTADEMTALLRGYIPDWTPPAQEERYRAAVSGGFSAPWLSLARLRREGGSGGDPLATLLDRAQSFMLGKLLWCIFEGRAVVRCGIDHELLRDADPEGLAFPQFRETPGRVRGLVRASTAGAAEWGGRGRGVVLRGGKLVPASWDGEGAEPSVDETREVARKWWASEVEAAKGVLGEITEVKNGTGDPTRGVLGDAMQRPLLREVLDELKRIEGEATGMLQGC
ncbi:U-box domain-containing protein 33 [Coniochaeta hoffmannii]|uniref:U-box domain-containing protein 33 n=1 Tax=Coniochaeta hoffmannii TaxID=91930 RepID=A0AA38VTF1_9PEZI|nr:U-box domain-containing protein 33 [Coniochaeta hoffmannii]